MWRAAECRTASRRGYLATATIHRWDGHEYQDAFEEDLERNSRKRLDIDEVS